MKTYSKHFQVNPLGRDLILLIFAGMFVAITLITAGFILVSQL
jgi:hypothetical protein